MRALRRTLCRLLRVPFALCTGQKHFPENRIKICKQMSKQRNVLVDPENRATV